jgi:mannosyltransferase OCH1-like enzyme
MGMGEGEGEGKPKPKLFQFWNTEHAPAEVEILMQGWAEDPAFDYHRFNTNSADAFIEAHFDKQTLAAYRECGVPAMQADFFRYCALYVHGGVYVDADTENSLRLPELLQTRVRGLLMKRQERVANDFLYVVNSADPLYLTVIETAVSNISDRISNNVWEVTGPGIMTQLRFDPDARKFFDGFDFEAARIVRDYVLFKHDLEYKSGNEDWRTFRDSDALSIFKVKST